MTLTERIADRIEARKPRPLPLIDCMGPFARRLALKQLAPKDTSLYLHDGCGPDGRSA